MTAHQPLSFAAQVADLDRFVAVRQAAKDEAERKLQEGQERARRKRAARKPAPASVKAEKPSSTRTILAVMKPGKSYRWGQLLTLSGLSKGAFSPSLNYLIRKQKVLKEDIDRASFYSLTTGATT